MIPAVATTALTTVNPINVIAVTRCALSAHTRPIRIVLSKPLSFPCFASAAAARNRAIFCCGVSPEGAGEEPKFICVADEGIAGFEEKFVAPVGGFVAA